MLTQVEIRTLSGEISYGVDGQQVLPEIAGSILLPRNREMLIRLCEHRKRVIDGTYKSKPLSEALMRQYRLRPEYARSASASVPSISNTDEREQRQRKAIAALA